ncbi:developmentally-regulated GTP-binding protein 2 isoform X3 [Lutra lutra]|nr:developmentally-regulated GTP-binding protein 2 isoform X3 [Lutra lutra]
MKSGDARVALIGFPSVGKSTFLSLMTSTASEAASYEFTTLTCIPGVIEYKGANIQLLDLPGIIEGAAQGKGRGRQVIAVARTADVVIMMLDATKGEVQRSLLEKELESVGIRLNKHRPNIYFKPKKGGGISFNSTVTLTQCSEKLVQLILHEYKIFNAEVLFREDCSPDEFIDVIVGNRVYMPCLYVYNKIDQISMEEVDRLARKPNSVVIRLPSGAAKNISSSRREVTSTPHLHLLCSQHVTLKVMSANDQARSCPITEIPTGQPCGHQSPSNCQEGSPPPGALHPSVLLCALHRVPRRPPGETAELSRA